MRSNVSLLYKILLSCIIKILHYFLIYSKPPVIQTPTYSKYFQLFEVSFAFPLGFAYST